MSNVILPFPKIPADLLYELPDSEAHLLNRILIMCSRLGLRVFHVDRGQVSMPGFPDLFIVGPCGHAFWELKSLTGTLSSSQEVWSRRIKESPGLRYSVITPLDWATGTAQRWLREIAGYDDDPPQLRAA